MRSKQKFSLVKLIILLGIVVLLTVGVTSFLYAKYKIVRYQEYGMLLKVTDNKNDVGIGIIPGMIYFGRMASGNGAMQKIEIKHNYYEPLLVQIAASGDLKKWVTLSENNFVLEKDVMKTINVTAMVPEGASLGNHTGKLKIYLKRI